MVNGCTPAFNFRDHTSNPIGGEKISLYQLSVTIYTTEEYVHKRSLMHVKIHSYYVFLLDIASQFGNLVFSYTGENSILTTIQPDIKLIEQKSSKNPYFTYSVQQFVQLSALKSDKQFWASKTQCEQNLFYSYSNFFQILLRLALSYLKIIVRIEFSPFGTLFLTGDY